MTRRESLAGLYSQRLQRDVGLERLSSYSHLIDSQPRLSSPLRLAAKENKRFAQLVALFF